MIYAPIIIPTLNRYSHLKNCVESLAACTHADKTDLIIGLDFPPSEKYIDGWKQIKKYLPTISGFKKVIIFERTENFGPVKNLVELKNYGFQTYGVVIQTEDDNVFSPCFLDYMNKALDYYKDNPSVIAVSGYMLPIEWKSNMTSTVVHIKHFMAWGIGSRIEWQKKLEEDMPEHYMEYVCSHRTVLWKFRKHWTNLYQLIFWTKNNPALDRRCDFSIASYLCINDKFVVNPCFSIVRNNGYDKSGVNCCEETDLKFSEQRISNFEHFELIDNNTEKEDVVIQNDFEDYIEEMSELKLTKQMKKKVIMYFFCYLIFGYKMIDVLAKLLHKLKGISKNFKKKERYN